MSTFEHADGCRRGFASDKQFQEFSRDKTIDTCCEQAYRVRVSSVSSRAHSHTHLLRLSRPRLVFHSCRKQKSHAHRLDAGALLGSTARPSSPSPDKGFLTLSRRVAHQTTESETTYAQTLHLVRVVDSYLLVRRVGQTHTAEKRRGRQQNERDQNGQGDR